jgi:uncharacterized RDD family membrane protein YckC
MAMHDPMPVIVEPEHVRPEMLGRKPGLTGVRVVAGLIDLVVLLIPFGLSLAFSSWLAWVFSGAATAAYYWLTEARMDGQTLGKKVAGLRVVDFAGERVTGRQVAVRTLLRVVDFLPFFYFLGVVLLLGSRGQQRIGDLVAGTRVVNARGSGH